MFSYVTKLTTIALLMDPTPGERQTFHGHRAGAPVVRRRPSVFQV
jgi:hypothetical protein